jgi:hypothetical protein
MNTNNITVELFFHPEPDTFVCELTDEQLKVLVDTYALRHYDENAPGTYTFDEDRIGEWEPGEFGAADLIALADALLRLPNHRDDLTDSEALALIAYCLSAPDWSVSFLEDIADIVWSTSHSSVKGATWNRH